MKLSHIFFYDLENKACMIVGNRKRSKEIVQLEFFPHNCSLLGPASVKISRYVNYDYLYYKSGGKRLSDIRFILFPFFDKM